MQAKPTTLLIIFAVLGAIAIATNTFYKNKLQNNHIDVDNTALIDELINQLRPEFTLPDLNGISRNISEWDGRVLAINFWASWCKPCLREIPAFIRLQKTYGPQGLQFIGLAVDDKENIVRFLKEMSEQVEGQINYPILIGDEDAIQIAKAYGNEFGILPQTVIIGRDSRIEYIQYGELTQELALQVIQPLL